MRLTRRPAGLPTDSSLRSAIEVNGACQIKINSRSKAEHGGLKADLSGRSKSQVKVRIKSCFSVGAGLPAMRTPRSTKYTELMLSQRFGGPTSLLPHLIGCSLQDQVGSQAASACF